MGEVGNGKCQDSGTASGRPPQKGTHPKFVVIMILHVLTMHVL